MKTVFRIQDLQREKTTKGKNRYLLSLLSERYLGKSAEDEETIAFVKEYIAENFRSNLQMMSKYINKTYLKKDPIFIIFNNLELFKIDIPQIEKTEDHTFYVWACGMLLDTGGGITPEERDIFTYNVRRVFNSINTFPINDVESSIQKITEVYLRYLFTNGDANFNINNMTTVIRRLTLQN